MGLKEVCEAAGLEWPLPARSLTYEEYCAAMKVVVPHGPDEQCTCEGCGVCSSRVWGCTCDIDWDLAVEIRDLWYA
jgi:hypothetical protein